MEDLSLLDHALVFAAALAGGFANALAGGGTLITFPALTAVGVPAVAANVTNTVALCPGYLGGTWAQRLDLRGQGRRLRLMAPVGVAGGICGGILLLASGERLFRGLVPFLILAACVLLASQGKVRAWAASRGQGERAGRQAPAGLLVFLASVYGGYFGAGLSIIILAVLAWCYGENLTRLNALKQGIAFAVNVAAACFFVASGMVVWTASAVMAVGSLLGGTLGGKVAGGVRPEVLRWVVVALGTAVAVAFLV